nr:MAG TPA: hypothetical protein [Caudoviricetes sp.]
MKIEIFPIVFTIIHLKLNFFNFFYSSKYFLLYKNDICWLLVGYDKKEGVFFIKKNGIIKIKKEKLNG